MAGVKTMFNNDWKDRAIERRLENKALKKRIKELKISRDGWHDRAMDYKQENDELTTKLNSIKKKIDQITEI
jgi:uncharacterized coiled-coil DUF342 family protein